MSDRPADLRLLLLWVLGGGVDGGYERGPFKAECAMLVNLDALSSAEHTSRSPH